MAHVQSAFAAPRTAWIEVSADLPDWRDLLDRHEDACLFHDPRWGQLMQQVYGNRPYYLTARRGGDLVGALQLVHQSSVLFGSRLCSLPYFDAAGILADDAEAAASLLDAAETLRDELGAESVELRHLQPAGQALPERTDKVDLRLPLPDDEQTLWKQLKAKVRNQVRKAERAGLTASNGSAERLGEFFDIYVRNMRDLGSPSHGRRFFRRIVETFPSESRIFVVRLDGRAVAASLTLADAHGLRVPWAGSDWRVRQLNANMLLYWSMLTEACRERAGCFDFGRSTRDAGTYKFKRQWGAEEVPLHWQYLLSAGAEVPALRHDSPKYRLMVGCWRKLPVPVARAIGPAIISKLA